PPPRADPRVLGADRPIPCCGARSENRLRQRHPARLGADHHQIRHRLATARTALARLRNSNPHTADIDDKLSIVSALRLTPPQSQCQLEVAGPPVICFGLSGLVAWYP